MISPFPVVMPNKSGSLPLKGRLTFQVAPESEEIRISPRNPHAAKPFPANAVTPRNDSIKTEFGVLADVHPDKFAGA
jgi:hypothetical protein